MEQTLPAFYFHDEDVNPLPVSIAFGLLLYFRAVTFGE